MSHGGFGGGGGHSGGGYGHGGGGGHSTLTHHSDHGSVFHAHLEHMPHDGGVLSHGLGIGGHGGAIIGHLLHALGLAHHAGHGLHSAHQPDQSPTWNQSMQSQRGWRQWLRRIDTRPFVFFVVISLISLGWLALIYTVHHHETAGAAGRQQQPTAPACAAYGEPAAGNAPPAVMPNRGYAGAASPYATAYGGAPRSPYYQAGPTAPMPAASYQMLSAYARQSMPLTAPYRNPSALYLGGQARYVASGNGRQRLVVSR